MSAKAAASVAASDFKHLQFLQQALGSRFVRGIILYTGRETVPFSSDLCALPVSALWTSLSQR